MKTIKCLQINKRHMPDLDEEIWKDGEKRPALKNLTTIVAANESKPLGIKRNVHQ